MVEGLIHTSFVLKLRTPEKSKIPRIPSYFHFIVILLLSSFFTFFTFPEQIELATRVTQIFGGAVETHGSLWPNQSLTEFATTATSPTFFSSSYFHENHESKNTKIHPFHRLLIQIHWCICSHCVPASHQESALRQSPRRLQIDFLCI